MAEENGGSFDTFGPVSVSEDGSQTMSVIELAAKRAERVVVLARELDQCSGSDGAAKAHLRREVEGLLRNDRDPVVPAVLKSLAGDPALGRVQRMIKRCENVFPREDCVHVAIAIAVSINLKSTRAGGCLISDGEQSAMRQVGEQLKRAMGARKVMFDRRIYRHGDLVGVAHARKDEYLQRLSCTTLGAGVEPLARQAVIRSTQEIRYDTVYFVGVAEFAHGGEDALESIEIRHRTKVWTKIIEFALDQSNPIAWTQGVDLKVKAETFRYLTDSLRAGKRMDRVNRLNEFVANFDQGVTGVDLRYCILREQKEIRLLASSHRMTAEHRWPMLDDGEQGGEFQIALNGAVETYVAEVNFVSELGEDKYVGTARSRGADGSWR